MSDRDGIDKIIGAQTLRFADGDVRFDEESNNQCKLVMTLSLSVKV